MKPLSQWLRILCIIAFAFALDAAEPAPEKKKEGPAVGKWPGIDKFPGKGKIPDADWFHAAWAIRRTEFWNNREKDKHAIVFLGDSITAGWTTLANDFPNFKVANRGIGGDTTRGILYRMKEDVLDLEPEAVVLLIGTNDIGLGATPEEAAENLKVIFARLKKHSRKMPVIVCKVMPSTEKLSRGPREIQKLNELVDKLIKGNRQFIRCDTWSVFADENGNAKVEEFPDRLHPNAAGYAKWKKALDPILATLNTKTAKRK